MIDIFTAGDFTDLPEGAQVLFIESSSRPDGRTWFFLTSLLTHGFPIRRL